jgi:hypothetical protein
MLSLTRHHARGIQAQHAEASGGTVYAMAVDSRARVAVTVGADRRLTLWRCATGQPLKTHRLHAADALHVSLDASGTVAVCCGADRVVRLVSTVTGQLLASAAGHAEVVTAAALSPDCAQVQGPLPLTPSAIHHSSLVVRVRVLLGFPTTWLRPPHVQALQRIGELYGSRQQQQRG